MLNTRQKQSEKRKSEPSLRLTKKAKITTGIKVHDIGDLMRSMLSGGEEDADEDGYEGKDDTTPFDKAATKGKGKTQDKNGIAESYRTRKKSFGELEHVRILHAHSEHAKENAHRKPQEAGQENLQLEIWLT
ncbi:hypothetical protein RHS04_03769 [Rhizoctonia solani]|uniref:Uncharacterized protein n=1 Tax=Rhizoctonia solani TaxID=456999 RepID=A0A8H7LI85_9AGAM|nr:hypothetical protein RHS04_03769 [Rhizoctonia solani]